MKRYVDSSKRKVIKHNQWFGDYEDFSRFIGKELWVKVTLPMQKPRWVKFINERDSYYLMNFVNDYERNSDGVIVCESEEKKDWNSSRRCKYPMWQVHSTEPFEILSTDELFVVEPDHD